MSTQLRARLSKSNKYYINAERRYELQHFCRQYPIWKEALYSLTGLQSRPEDLEIFRTKHHISDPTAKCAIIRKFYQDRIDMIEKAAFLADPELCKYIVMGVTEGRNYDNLSMVYKMPCSKKTYYDRYKKFFFELNLLRE